MTARPWNVFDAPPEAGREAAEQRRTRAADTAAALGPRAAGFLRDRLAAEGPSYRPGDSFDLAAWREGRKAALAELLAELTEAHTPGA